MSDDEVNKIIADYMGVKKVGKYWIIGALHIDVLEYTKSLDALVPVWEKLLKDYKLQVSMFCNPLGFFEFEVFDNKEGGLCEFGNDKKPERAASYATAKAILELTKHNEKE